MRTAQFGQFPLTTANTKVQNLNDLFFMLSDCFLTAPFFFYGEIFVIVVYQMWRLKCFKSSDVF